MAEDHRTLVSADVHEPKHISDSTSADAGKVITPLSGGSSELRNLTPSEVGVQFLYGEASLDSNTTSFSITAASDSSLYTTDDYVQLNSTRVPGMYLDHSAGVTFNDTTNGLIAPETGVYQVAFWMSVETDTNNTLLAVKGKNNGSWANFTVKHDIAELDRTNMFMGYIFTDINEGDSFTIWMASDKTADIVISDMRYSIQLVNGG